MGMQWAIEWTILKAFRTMLKLSAFCIFELSAFKYTQRKKNQANAYVRKTKWILECGIDSIKRTLNALSTNFHFVFVIILYWMNRTLSYIWMVHLKFSMQFKIQISTETQLNVMYNLVQIFALNACMWKFLSDCDVRYDYAHFFDFFVKEF